ncbi:MAG: ATPase [Clostridium sp.]|nr:ATPase [Clostridium sp.]
MKIAVLSGKGGTGKTFVATNLARVAGKSVYLDCDIEEPNGHLFLNGPILKEDEVALPIPKVKDELCNGCKDCVEFCRFNALSYVSNKVMVFDKICHSCGGCKIVCPQNAICEEDKVIGHIESRLYKETSVFTGRLIPGEESGTSIIHDLYNKIKDENSTVIVDSPPGSACIVMDSIKDADFCLLVAEPTIFGAYNLEMVHKLVKMYKKPHGVVLNKSSDDFNCSRAYCIENNIQIFADIPFDKNLGKLNAEGKLVIEHNIEAKKLFSDLLERIIKELNL